MTGIKTHYVVEVQNVNLYAMVDSPDPSDETLTGTTAPGQCRPESNRKEEVLHTP